MAICALCGCDTLRSLFAANNVHGRSILGSESFNILECPNCSIVYTDVQVTAGYFKKYYPCDYYPATASNISIRCLESSLASLSFKFHLGLIKRYAPRASKILEIGCARGEFLRRLPAAYKKFGIEINDDFAGYLRENCKDISVSSVKIGSGVRPFPGQTFECIILWEVFEHIDNPVAFIKEISLMLSEHGIIILEMPNRNSLGFLFTGSDWFHIDTPRHIFFYSKRSLQNMLQTCGLSIVGFGSNPVDYVQDLAMSFLNRTRAVFFPLRVVIVSLTLPICLFVRCFLSAFVPDIAEINIYVVRPKLKRGKR
jgi:SAM-dependent methyltransferase